MKGFWRYWGLGLTLGIILLLGPGGVLSVRADGMDRKRPRGTDYQVFRVELHNGGAFKFYSDSEDTLRSGDFEQAFSRYLFLASHIRGQSMYAGLAASVDRRLHFLMRQLGLGEESLRFARTTRRISVPAPPPPAPKPEPKPAPTPKPAEDQESPPAAVIPGAKPGEFPIPPVIVDDQKTAPPTPGSQSPPEAAKADKDDQAEKTDKAEDKPPPPPPPPPSAWEKVKRRLKFW